MGDKITLNIAAREVHGKKVRSLRQAGLTPGVIYGHGMEPLAIQADSSELRKVVAAAGKHTPVNLTGAKRRIAMIKDVEYSSTKTGLVQHVAFHAVNADEPVHAVVPLHLTGEGESEAERVGLIVLQSIDKLEVKALPMELPEALEVSILNLREAGDRVTIADIVLPKGVELVEHTDNRSSEEQEEDEHQSIKDLVVATVYEPSALAAANDAAAGDGSAEAEVPAAQGGDEPVAPSTENVSK